LGGNWPELFLHTEGNASSSSHNKAFLADNPVPGELPLRFVACGRNPSTKFPSAALQCDPLTGHGDHALLQPHYTFQHEHNIEVASYLPGNIGYDSAISIESKDVDTLIPFCNQSDFNSLGVADATPGMISSYAPPWHSQVEAGSYSSSLALDGVNAVFPALAGHIPNAVAQFSPSVEVHSSLGLVPRLALDSAYRSSQFIETPSVSGHTNLIRRTAGGSTSK
jgi:hypothetical protein